MPDNSSSALSSTVPLTLAPRRHPSSRMSLESPPGEKRMDFRASFYSRDICGSNGADRTYGTMVSVRAGVGTRPQTSGTKIGAVQGQTGDDDALVTFPPALLPGTVQHHTAPPWSTQSKSSPSDSKAESYASRRSRHRLQRRHLGTNPMSHALP